MICYNSLPFEGTDPLCAGKNKTKISSTDALAADNHGKNSKISSTSAQIRGSCCTNSSSSSAVDDKTRRHEEESCTSLAVRIIKLAKLKLKEDIELQFQEKSLLKNTNDIVTY